MPNPIVKLWKYLSAWGNDKIDAKADPRIQIQQALAAEQRRHEALTRQAASVLGNQRQLEMRLSRQLGDAERLRAAARQALVLAAQARADGNPAESAQHENVALMFATQLVAVEQSVEDLERSRVEALHAAEMARGAVEQSRTRLQTQLAERATLVSRLEQAKMTEHVAASFRQVTELSAPGSVPSLGEIRGKIEARYANALGHAELAQSFAPRMFEVQRAVLDVAGASRLDPIRASLAAPPAVGALAAAPALEAGAENA